MGIKYRLAGEWEMLNGDRWLTHQEPDEPNLSIHFKVPTEMKNENFGRTRRSYSEEDEGKETGPEKSEGGKKFSRYLRLYQIEGLNGRKGGWVESEMNLSQSGDCWINEGAIVCGKARVMGDAVVMSGQIGGDAVVGGKAVISGDTVISGMSKVFGKVESSKIHGSYVNSDAEVVGCEVEYSAVYGKADKALLKDGSAVYGEVSGGCTLIDATVLPRAKVEGKFILKGCRVDGEISKGKSKKG